MKKKKTKTKVATRTTKKTTTRKATTRTEHTAKWHMKTVIAEFGSLRKMGKLVKRSPAAVHNWIKMGYIPESARTQVIAAAKRKNITIPKVLTTG